MFPLDVFSFILKKNVIFKFYLCICCMFIFFCNCGETEVCMELNVFILGC